MTVLARRLPLPPLSAVGCCQIRWRRLALPCPSCTKTFFVLSRQPLHCLLLCLFYCCSVFLEPGQGGGLDRSPQAERG